MEKSFYAHIGFPGFKNLEFKRLAELGYKILIIDDLGSKPKDELYHTYIYEHSRDPNVIANLINKFSNDTGLHLEHIFTFADGSVDIVNDLCKIFSKPLIYEISTDSIRNKYEMRKRLENDGITLKTLLLVRSEDEIPKLNEDLFPLIIKPVDSLDSRSVTKSRSQNELRSACLKVFSSNTHLPLDIGPVSIEERYKLKPFAIIETFIDGQEYSSEVVVIRGKIANIFVTYKISSGEPYFYEIGHSSGHNFLTTIQMENLIKLVNSIIRTSGFHSTVLHIEFKVNNNVVMLIECNTRLGGDQISDLVEKAYGANITDVFFTYLKSNKAANQYHPKLIASKIFISTETEGIFHIKDTYIDNIKIDWHKNEGDLIRKLKTAGASRLGTVNFISFSQEEFDKRRLLIIKGIPNTFSVNPLSDISLAKFLIKRIRSLYFWVLSFLAIICLIMNF